MIFEWFFFFKFFWVKKKSKPIDFFTCMQALCRFPFDRENGPLASPVVELHVEIEG